MAQADPLLRLITEFTDGNQIWKDAAIQNAWAEVQRESRKGNPTVRNTIIKHFSDYISRQPPFRDEPKEARDQYTNPKSLPDTELDMDDWLEIAGQDILDRLERGGATPMTSRITAEIKQHAGVGGGGATTVTQRVIKGEDFENFKRDFPNMMNQEWGNASQPQLLKWVSSQPKYFQGVKAQFNEKLRNYIVVNWVDKQHRGIGQRPKFGVVPGAAKKLNIQNINNFKKYVFIEARVLKGIPSKVKDIYRKTGGTLRKEGLSEKHQQMLPTSWDSGFEGRVVKKGDPIPVELISSFSLQFRLTAEGDKFLEKAVSDITSKVYDKLAVDLLPRMVDYIYKQMGKKTNSHAYLVEMLQIAREFSEKFDETPILIQSNIVKQKFGGINSKGKMNTTRSFMQRSGGGGGRGQFISAVQLSAILQHRLSKTMPRYSEPQRPIPRYITGGLARSFQVMVNYRLNLISYFNSPPVSGYVDQLNTRGWLLDKGLVAPTISQITQELFGRAFKVQRTQ